MDMDLSKVAASAPAGDTVEGTISRQLMYRGRTYGKAGTSTEGSFPREVVLRDKYLDAKAALIADGTDPATIPSFGDLLKHDKSRRAAEALVEGDEPSASTTDSGDGFDVEAAATRVFSASRAASADDDGTEYDDLPESEKMRVRAMAAALAGLDATQYRDAADTLEAAAREMPDGRPGPPQPNDGPDENAPKTPPPVSLPDDFPHVAKLRAQGIQTFDDLAKIKSHEDLDGIGETRWSEIQEAVPK